MTVESSPRVVVVTNDFPPRLGGVQSYVWNLVRHLPADRVVVLAPRWPGSIDHDGRVGFAVERWPATVMSPSPAVARRATALVREHRADVVLFGHGFPLPLIGPWIARSGTPYVVLTHGAEVWQACVPGAAAAIRRSLLGAAAVTAVSRFTSAWLWTSLRLPRRPIVLWPGVDERRFAPDLDGSPVRARLGIDDRPSIVSISRLVPRKGHDTLIRAMTNVRRLVPGATLLIGGEGPYRGRLEALAAEAPPGSVVFAGAIPEEDLPAHYASGDVFAMPCRDRFGGLEVEGFGIVFLEAAATGKAVVAGRSGGAAESIVDGQTGLLTEGREPNAVAVALTTLLLDDSRRAAFGDAGRARVEASFTWASRAELLARVLSDAAG